MDENANLSGNYESLVDLQAKRISAFRCAIKMQIGSGIEFTGRGFHQEGSV